MKTWLIGGGAILALCALFFLAQPPSRQFPLPPNLIQIRAEANIYSRKADSIERFARASRSLVERGGRAPAAPTVGTIRNVLPTVAERALANPKRPGNSVCTTKGGKMDLLFECSSYTPGVLTEAAGSLQRSVASAFNRLCSSRETQAFKVSLDCRYVENYKTLFESNGFGGGGWVNRAVVTTLNKKRYHKGSLFMEAIGIQVDSVHRWSTTAGIVLLAVEGEVSYEDLGGTVRADKWPRAAVFWLSPTNSPMQASFLQLRGMLLGFALAAVHFEVGMVAGPLLDNLLERAALHTSSEHPYPIYPQFNLGHSNPTFAYHALPFLSFAYVRAATDANRGNGHNIANDWISSPGISRNLTRQWCKWDIGALPANEMLVNNYNLKRAPTFVNRAYGHPNVFGYAFFSPEGNVDRVTIKRLWPTVQRINPKEAAKHWLYHDNDWHDVSYDVAETLGLDCLV